MGDLSQKEAEIVEFQSTFGDEVVEALVAFSNTRGGTVYVGISKEGEIQGLTLNEETIAQWIDTIKGQTNPEITLEFAMLNIEGKHVLSLRVSESLAKPVAVNGRHIKRVGSQNYYLNAEEIAIEFLKTNPHNNCVVEEQDDASVASMTKKRKASNRRKYGDNAQKIIKLIKADSYITIRKIVERTGLSVKCVEKNIQRMKAEGVVRRIGPNRGGKWQLLLLKDINE